MSSYLRAAPVLRVFVQAFRTPDLRKKLLFTGAVIVLFRFGSKLPAPGISEQNVSYCAHLSSSSGFFGIVNLLSGNALLHLTVFAIGILPYITASIIVQMLTQVIPRLETLRKEGQAGQAKITTYLAYVLSRLTAPGSVYLALVAMFPLVVIDKIGLGQELQLSGVSLLIMAGVGLDTVKQIQSQLEQHSYEGFLG